MKRRKWIVALPLLFLLLFPNFACTVVGLRGGYEERAHKVLVDDGSFQIRQYEPGIVAETTSEGSFDDGQGRSFGQLAGYIFGGNQEEQDIAMTTPVELSRPETTEPGEAWTMKFFLPKEYELEDLPAPAEGARVAIKPIEGEMLAIRRFTWILDDEDLETYEPELREWIDSQGYQPTGPARLAGYDPPWTIPFLRRNEVLIPVKKAD